MKKTLFFIIVFFLFVTAPAFAVMLAWDQHTDSSVLGYNFYWVESGTSNTPFVKNLPGIDTVTYTVDDLYLKPDVEYDFYVTAYNSTGESPPSTVVKWTRVVPPYTPPQDNLPTETYPVDIPADAPQGFGNI